MDERDVISSPAGSWEAELALGYGLRGGRSVLERRRHRGPLRVQRDLYPEGEAVCHTIVVHPPGGVAGGDYLTTSVDVGAGARALLTTPGATKWYRSDGPSAHQLLAVTLAAGASAEWLPQESIFFDGADAELRCEVEMAPGSAYLGWEILCMGRRAAGERFARGRLRVSTELWRAGQRVWVERGRLDGDDPLFRSPVGLAGRTVVATLLAAGDGLGDDALAACRGVIAGAGASAGVTRLPGLVVARWLGDSSEQARRYLTQLWTLLRPRLLGRAAVPPRIWAT